MPALRVTAGSFRGRRVPLAPHHHRPTSERARQAWFNAVGPSVAGAHFLDLFCGSGIFSIEAVSRGAASALAVDISPKATKALHEITRELAISNITVMQRDVLVAIASLRGSFSLVYADPPYEYPSYEQLLLAIDRCDAVAEDAIIGIEHSAATPLPEAATSRLVFRKTFHHGNVAFTLFDRSPSGA